MSLACVKLLRDKVQVLCQGYKTHDDLDPANLFCSSFITCPSASVSSWKLQRKIAVFKYYGAVYLQACTWNSWPGASAPSWIWRTWYLHPTHISEQRNGELGNGHHREKGKATDLQEGKKHPIQRGDEEPCVPNIWDGAESGSNGPEESRMRCSD